MKRPANTRLFKLFALAFGLASSSPALAQDALDGIDLTSENFTKAEMSRAAIENGIAALTGDAKLDLTGKALNGLDLAGLDLTKTDLSQARLNKANLTGANLSGVSLLQVWAVESDFTGANLSGTNLGGAIFLRSKMDGANFTKAFAAANFNRASLTKTVFDGAELSPGKKNVRSMFKLGFEGAALDGASFKGANMTRTYCAFATMTNANLAGAHLNGADLSGANLTGADITGADLDGADVADAKISGWANAAAAKNIDKLVNADRASKHQ